MRATKKLPLLRYKEFNGEWKPVKLGEICETFKSGESITSKDIFESGQFPVYGGNGLRGYANTYTHDGFYTLIGRQGALCGNINRVYGKSFISEHAIAVSTNKSSDTEWLAQRLDKMKLNRLSESSAQPGLAVNKLLKIKLNLPTLPEQQKIASFLSAVDEKIQQLTRKKELLEQYKKGVMQQLFSGKLRFKDDNGKAFPKWEIKKLGEICEKIQDGNYGASYPKAEEFIKTGIPFLTSKALSNSGNIVKEKIDFISNEKHSELKKAQLKINDLLFTNRGSNVGSIGLVDIFIAHGNIGPQLTLLRSKPMILYYNFLFYAMNTYGFKKQINSQDSGSAMNFFGIGETAKFKLAIPCLEEQKKIANYLSSIDNKMESVNKQITQTQTFKKGLLQQMFV